MGVIQEFFNNREIAIGIWVIIGLAVILPTKPARQFIKTAIPILFCKKFVIFYIVFLSFLGLVLFALNWAGLWDLTLLKDTVFWVLFVELPLFSKAIEKADGGRFFSKLIRENVAIVVAIEFFVGFWTFSLITEIILIPLTVLISVLQVLAGQDKKHRSVKRFFDGLLVLWGIILLINAIYSLIHAPNQFLSFDTLKSLLLPLVLLVFNLPVVYGLALYNTYEQIFIRIKGSKSEQKKMKWQVIRFSGINLSKVSAIRKSLPNTIVCCRTSNDLQINLKKLARRLDLQIGENYMKRSRYYVLACIAGLILSFIGLIGANSDVSLKDLVTLNFVFDIPRKSTILEALSMVLTGKINSSSVANRLNLDWFNAQVRQKFKESIEAGNTPDLPTIEIEVYFASPDEDEIAIKKYRGTNNSLHEDAEGVKLEIIFDTQYAPAYKQPLVEGKVRDIPVEYYRVNFRSFANPECW